jgi:PAS domain S-box-containing protein
LRLLHWTVDAFGPLITRRSRRRTIWVLAIASALMVGLLAVRLANSDADNGLLALQVIPIALVAMELGLLPGVAFAAAAFGSVVAWDLAQDVGISPGGYIARAVVYLLVAIGIGWITGRLRVATERTRETEERLGAVVEYSTDALISSDSAGRIFAWNPAAERTFGWSAEEAVGKLLPDLVMPESISQLYWAGLRQFLDRGERSMIGRRFESLSVHRDGHEFPIEIAISAVAESGGWSFHAFMHDITERKHEQDERRLLASIVDSSGDAILSFTLEGVITSWNPSAERIYGYSEDEAVGMTLFDFVLPDQPDDVAPLLKRVRSGGRLDNVEVDRIGKGGRQVEVAVTAAPITGDSDRVVGGAAIHRDVSDRKRRDRYLAAQHGATRVLAQAPELAEVGTAILPLLAGAGSWLCAAYWAADGHSLHCDAAWTAPRTRLPVNPILEGAVSEQEQGDEELQWLATDLPAGELPSPDRAAIGGLRTQVWAPIVAGGELFGAFHFFDRRRRQSDEELISALTAITSQIANYLQRRRAEEEVERAKDEFFGLVSHELRTPLTSIIGYSELLEDSETDHLTDQGRKYLDVIHRNAQREMRLVGDLLLLVRIQEGSFRIELETVDLERIVEQSVEGARPAAGKREIQLAAETDSTPPCEGDAHRLGQVVDNLLSNAIKFTPKGGSVGVRLESTNGVATIEVADSGVGIPADEQELLFNRLYRAPSATMARVPGLGLGLTIVKAIVDAHAGRVNVRSTPGAGATFRVELPIRGPEVHTEEAVE